MSDIYKTLLLNRPQVLSSGGSGLVTQANNLSDVSDVATARTNLGVISETTTNSRNSSNKEANWLYSDGATTNRAIVQTPGARGNLAGSLAANWIGWVDVPSSSSSAEIAGISSSTSALASATAWSMGIAFSTNDLIVRANGATVATDYRTFTCTAFRTNYTGQRVWLDVRFTTGTTAPTVYVNGSSVSGTAANGAGTSPNWLSSSLVATYHVTGYNWGTGSVPLGSWLNASVTNTESDTWRTTGRAPAWVQFGGSAVNATGDATLTTDSSWSDPYNCFLVSGGSIVGTAVPQYGYIGSLASAGTRILTAGSRVRWKVVVSAISGGNNFVLQQGGNGTIIQNITAATTYSGTYTATTNDNQTNSFVIKNLSATASGITVTSVEWYVDGALSLPSVQSIDVVEDATKHSGNQGRLVGITPILSTNQLISVVERPAEAYTTTSIQLLGGAVSGGRKRRIVSVTGNSSASVNLSLGTSTSGTQLVSAQAVNGDFDISTFASRILAAGSSLYLTFSGSTTASITIYLTDL